MKRVIWLLLVSSALSQTQGNLPDLADSNASQSIGLANYTIPMPEYVQTGDLLDVCIAYNYQQSGNTGPFAVTDGLGNTYTLTSLALTPNIGHNQTAVYHAYTISGATGQDTITAALPAVQYSMTAGRFQGLSGTLDGSVQVGTQSTAGAQTISTTNTTTTHGSVLVSCGAGDTYSGGNIATGTGEYVAENSCSNAGCAVPVFQSMLHTTAKGSYTLTDNTFATFAFGSNMAFVEQTLAFKPSATIAIVDTALPDAAVSTAYAAQLHEVGGTGTLTYNQVSGAFPTGLSVSSSGAITGTPSGAPGNYTIGFHVTDGTVTSPTVTLTIALKSAFLTPSVQEQRHANDEMFGASDNITFSQSVVCGQVIAISFYGQDTHSINGWVTDANGTFNYIRDSLGTIFTRVGPIAGSLNAPQVWYIGQATASGQDTVTITPSTPSSGLYWTGAVLNNVQPVVDRGTFTATGTGVLTNSSSYTSIVPNTLVVVSTNTSNNANGGFDSGFSYSGITAATIDYGVTSSAAGGSSLLASPSALNVTSSFAALNGAGNIVNGMFGFRPAAAYSGVCSASLQSLNEKRRRQIF